MYNQVNLSVIQCLASFSPSEAVSVSKMHHMTKAQMINAEKNVTMGLKLRWMGPNFALKVRHLFSVSAIVKWFTLAEGGYGSTILLWAHSNILAYLLLVGHNYH